MKTGSLPCNAVVPPCVPSFWGGYRCAVPRVVWRAAPCDGMWPCSVSCVGVRVVCRCLWSRTRRWYAAAYHGEGVGGRGVGVPFPPPPRGGEVRERSSRGTAFTKRQSKDQKWASEIRNWAARRPERTTVEQISAQYTPRDGQRVDVGVTPPRPLRGHLGLPSREPPPKTSGKGPETTPPPRRDLCSADPYPHSAKPSTASPAKGNLLCRGLCSTLAFAAADPRPLLRPQTPPSVPQSHTR